MHSDANGNSKTGIYVGRTLSILASLWMILDPVMKLLKPGFVVKATTKLGYHESTIVGIGVTLLISTVLYGVPRTSVFGAIC
jgi:DoxX-like family